MKVGPTRLANELVEDVRIRGQEKLRGFLVFFWSELLELYIVIYRADENQIIVGLLNLSFLLDIQMEMLGRQLDRSM